MSERIGCSEHRALCTAAAQCLFTASTKPKSGGGKENIRGVYHCSYRSFIVRVFFG